MSAVAPFNRVSRNERSPKKGIDTLRLLLACYSLARVEMREAQRRALTSSSSSFIDGEKEGVYEEH